MPSEEKNRLVKTGLVWLLFFAIFLLAHLSINGLFGPDDPYYHAKHSQLMAESGRLDLVEPWLEFHFFKYAPTDPWWGYHLILAGLIYLAGPFLGSKILAAILAAAVFAVFYYFLSRWRTAKPFVWTFLFFSSSALFQFRLLLERPLLLSMIFLPLAFWLISRKKYWGLFFLSLLYTLSYNLGPLVIPLGLACVFVEYLFEKKIDLKIVLAASGGVLAGVFVHPRSLNYFYVMFVHFWQVLYLKFVRGIELGVGEEIQIKSFIYFLRANFIVLVFFILALAVFFAFKFWRREEKKITITTLALMSSFWLALALVVPRAVDYWLPFAWLFIALILSVFSQNREYGQIKDFLNRKINFKISRLFIYAAILLIAANNFLQIFNQLKARDGAEDYNFKEANQWLKTHTAKGSIVFYDNWSYWPVMFFYNDYNRYITGMDPTFLYEYSPDLFWLWHNLAKKGIYCPRADECPELKPSEKLSLVKFALKENFQTDYILAANNPSSPLIKTLNSQKNDFIKVFVGPALVIYKIK